MHVTISYHDDAALTIEEVVKQAQSVHGPRACVEVKSDSSAPHDQIYFALQQMLTYRQLSLFFEDKHVYQTEIGNLRAEALQKLTEILDTVIVDNEARIT